MIDIKQLKNNITDDQIIQILKYLGATKHIDTTNYIIFPTICHNGADSNASMKLYYYRESKLFRCYTECDDSFDIIDLIIKNRTVEKIPINFYEALNIIFQFTGNSFSFEISDDVNKYESIASYYYKKGDGLIIPPCNSNILEIFYFYPTQEWLNEKITVETMKKFNILYSVKENKIIIPHYNKDGILIGVRGRSLDPLDAELNGKYRPIRSENIIYSHSLSFNLYGLDQTKDNIRKTQQAIIFEGEKSVLKFDSLNKDFNNAVAVCGSSINKAQIMMLLEHGAKEIVIAFDKQYKTLGEESEKYFNKLINLSNKYKNYSTFSFLYDMEDILDYKDSPIDQGLSNFQKLYAKRIRVK
jgi:hypothetical protein